MRCQMLLLKEVHLFMECIPSIYFLGEQSPGEMYMKPMAKTICGKFS